MSVINYQKTINQGIKSSKKALFCVIQHPRRVIQHSRRVIHHPRRGIQHSRRVKQHPRRVIRHSRRVIPLVFETFNRIQNNHIRAFVIL